MDAAMNRRSLLEQLAIIRSLFRKESSADDDAAATAAARSRNVVEGRTKEGVRLINDQMAAVSTELLLTVMSDMMLLCLLDGLGLEEGRVVPSSDVASDQQLMMMDVAAAASATKKMKRAAAVAAKKKRYKRNKAAAKHKKTKLMSWLGGGLISLIMMIAFGSITILIFPLSLIHQSDGSGEGGAPPALPPSASKSLRQKDHRSNYDEAVSSNIDIISPLPAVAVAVVPPSIFLPTAVTVSNRRMKSDEELRASPACVDTPGWKDIYGDGCDWYEEQDYCPYADTYAGNMGPASQHCCICGGGSHTLPPTNSPTIPPTISSAPSLFPTVSSAPSSSSKPSNSPTISSAPSSSSKPSSSPTQVCVDTPNWEDQHIDGCDCYERRFDPGCNDANAGERAGDMGNAKEHCCFCNGGSVTCEDFRSKCQKYINVEGLGIVDGVVSPLCKEAESCYCAGADHVTVGLYNECKCDFWSRLCEDTGVGDACDYAAEYCCGDYEYGTYIYNGFNYLNSHTCYCDFFNYAKNDIKHVLKTKALNNSIEFANFWLCGELEDLLPSSFSEDERTSLEAIYKGTNGQNWTNNAGWMNKTVDHCEWYGISCENFAHMFDDVSNVNRYVTSIDLSDNNLAGQFPIYTRNTNSWGLPVQESEWEWTKFGLANLYNLKTLDLADNRLTGTIEYLPLYNLVSLTHFDVSGNQLSGKVDALVTPSATHSDFSNNRFTSTLGFKKYKISPLQTLRFCDMSDNAIHTDATDIFDNIPPNIEQFFASNNQFYGSLPALLNDLPQLRQFNISSNSLSGIIPESYNNLPQLRQFDMSSNALYGELPNLAESILSLQELDLSNQTNGFTGSIPEDLSKFQSLKILNLAGNKLTGTIPPAIGNMAALKVFDLSNNLLKSSIPAELGMLTGTLKRLDLANNTLSGKIPSQIGQLQGASVLLKDNSFQNNSIAPLSLCLESEVEDFDLAYDMTFCPIERNALSDFYDSAKGAEWTDGSMWLDEYASYCDWKGVVCEKNRVTELNLANNGLSGRLSESIGNLTFIEVLDLSDNDIKGSIPAQIGLLSNLTYLRLSYNAFTGAAPESLGELTHLQLLQLQSNRITEMSSSPQLDGTLHNKSTFVTDCGVPSAFDEALECEHCTMCCNANEDCYPQQKTLIAEHLNLNYSTFAAVLIAGFIAFCCIVALSLYLFSKRKNRGNALTTSTEKRLEEDDKYALSRIGKESVYSYFVTDKVLGWIVAFATLGIQIGLLFVFIVASEVKLQDDAIDIQFTWKCPRDSDVCKNTADLAVAGWFIFSMLMIANLAKDMISGSKLIYHSSEVRHPLGSRIRYFIGGTLLCSITLFALYVSTVYNKAIATSNTEIIVNSVVVLFVMDLDEWIFAALEACNEKWTKHAADAEDSSSEAEKGDALDEMKDKITLQDAQIADQQKELMRQKIQIEQMARRFGELELQEGVQNMQESQAGSCASFETVFYCDTADAVESEDAQLDAEADADAREGGKMTMNGTKIRNHNRKIRLGIRRGRGRPSKLNASSSGYTQL